MKFIVKEHFEDDVEFFVGETSVGRVNHDEHGWDGMRAAIDLFENVAAALGVEVQSTVGD